MKLFSLCSPIRVFVRACLQARLHRVLQKFNQLMSVSVKKVQYYFFNFMKWCTRVENWQRNYIHMQQSTSIDIMDLWAIGRFLADLSIIHKYTFDINNPLHNLKCNGNENLAKIGSNTLMLVYHCHKPVFTPKIAIWRAGMREGGLPLPLAFQYLIPMIWRAYDLSMVMTSSLASK